ncbi:unnamed protein product [Fraxinus pennsylvanica]|uniref:B box-type domain-containing protein n=1 Tax=Fraxinus pennsylvanica TaxID=56036 RepID=A0AAD1ZTF0_9LAMI|nr:unnamed protein product [Fraxinus pennsylvanica]
MKNCVLCKSTARMYCDSDQAILCWDCDARVHTANFLVAKHTRTLLCHVCQSSTPWTGSGPKLAPTVSVCQSCVNTRNPNINGDFDHEDGDAENDSEDEEDQDDDHDHDGSDDDEGDNQVVPLVSSSSSSEESSRRFCRETDDLQPPNDHERSQDKSSLKISPWT